MSEDFIHMGCPAQVILSVQKGVASYVIHLFWQDVLFSVAIQVLVTSCHHSRSPVIYDQSAYGCRLLLKWGYNILLSLNSTPLEGKLNTHQF